MSDQREEPDQDAGPPGDGIHPIDHEGPDPDPPPEPGPDRDGDDDAVDERSKESFPTSDPPATWAGPDEP